ncbi:MAG TPA: integrase arm-type DNA-binding domain-containing protein [Rhizobiaceae bacterium]|nr:integrase arm-type DNA-binding domain-containing protein [Rhizobiaceae bacterium]
MARPTNKLSALAVKSENRPGRHGDGGGLYLQVGPTGAKSWVYMWRRDNKRTAMGLGSYPAVSLADAREKATNCRRIVAAGGNPLAESRKGAEQEEEAEQEKKVRTFGDVADELLAAMETGWKNAKHRDQWYMTLSRRRDDDGNLVKDGYCLDLINMDVDLIGTDDVLKVLQPIWLTKAETASRLRGRIERVFAYAKTRHWRTGENPALWRGHLSNLLQKRKKLQRGHHPAMPYADVPAFMVRLRDRPAISARALEFTIITVARSGETYSARWPEIDFEHAIWTIPPERMKGEREHRVPLVKRALDILRELHKKRLFDDGLIFPGQKLGAPLSSNAMDALLQERMKPPQFTVHGFRSSFRDWAGDLTFHQREVVEAALAHKVGDETEQAYRRSDALAKRRRLMEDWAGYLDGKTAKVLTFAPEAIPA